MRSYFYFSNLRQSQIVYPSSLFRRITPLSLFHKTEETKLIKNSKNLQNGFRSEHKGKSLPSWRTRIPRQQNGVIKWYADKKFQNGADISARSAQIFWWTCSIPMQTILFNRDWYPAPLHQRVILYFFDFFAEIQHKDVSLKLSKKFADSLCGGTGSWPKCLYMYTASRPAVSWWMNHPSRSPYPERRAPESDDIEINLLDFLLNSFRCICVQSWTFNEATGREIYAPLIRLVMKRLG